MVPRSKGIAVVRASLTSTTGRSSDVLIPSSKNTFAFVSATHGGDGFLLYAGLETMLETGAGGSNDNLVSKCDFSYAVANGVH